MVITKTTEKKYSDPFVLKICEIPDEEKPFDDLVRLVPHAYGKVQDVAIAVDLVEKTISLQFVPHGLSPEDSDNNTEFFLLKEIPTPEGANTLLGDWELREKLEVFVKMIESNIPASILSYFRKEIEDHVDELISHGYCKTVDVILAKHFFDDEDTERIYREYDMGQPNVDFLKIAEEIEEEFNGSGGGGENLYLLEVVDYLHFVSQENYGSALKAY